MAVTSDGVTTWLGRASGIRPGDRALDIGCGAPEALRNVTFEHADAQVHRLPAKRFDLTISRFGTLFFRDPSPPSPTSGGRRGPAGA